MLTFGFFVWLALSALVGGAAINDFSGENIPEIVEVSEVGPRSAGFWPFPQLGAMANIGTGLSVLGIPIGANIGAGIGFGDDWGGAGGRRANEVGGRTQGDKGDADVLNKLGLRIPKFTVPDHISKAKAGLGVSLLGLPGTASVGIALGAGGGWSNSFGYNPKDFKVNKDGFYGPGKPARDGVGLGAGIAAGINIDSPVVNLAGVKAAINAGIGIRNKREALSAPDSELDVEPDVIV